MAKRKTDEEWINIFYQYYDKAEFNLVKLHRISITTFEIKHLTCGTIFFVDITHLYRKDGCPNCRPNKIKSDEDYQYLFYTQPNIEGLTLISIDRKTKYVKYVIHHAVCGTSFSLPTADFINRGDRCPTCRKNAKKSLIEYQNLFNNEYGVDWYELLDKSNYKDYNNKYRIKFTILCKTCNKTFTTTDTFKGLGCPHCNISVGEKTIARQLDIYKVYYLTQHCFRDCKNIRPLKFDFYVPKYKIAIEYDGEQHFKPIDFFGGEGVFKIQQENDEIKDKYCEINNIKLIRIPYTEFDNISHIIEEVFHGME